MHKQLNLGQYLPPNRVYRRPTMPTQTSFLFSNDGPLPALSATEWTTQEGIGVFVGAGSLPSLLPIIGVRHPFMVDRNKAVVACSKALCELIVACKNPEGAVHNLTEKLLSDEDGRLWPTDIQRRISEQYKEEKIRLGRSHWSYKYGPTDNFERAQCALTDRPPYFVAADIGNRHLAHTFATIHHEQGITIDFANMTNAFDPQFNNQCHLGTVSKWPFSSGAHILSSSTNTQLTRRIEPAQDFFVRLMADKQ